MSSFLLVPFSNGSNHCSIFDEEIDFSVTKLCSDLKHVLSSLSTLVSTFFLKKRLLAEIKVALITVKGLGFKAPRNKMEEEKKREILYRPK